MSIKVIRYRLPSYWACPLINDDYTGLTDEECEEIDGNILKMVGYFRGSEKEGQVFCDMITERIEKYEKRMSYDKGKLNN